MGKVDADAAVLHLYIDEGDVMVFGHGVRHTTHLHLNTAIVETGYHGEVLLYTGVYGIHSELFHLFSATYYGNLGIYHFLYYITAMFTFEKSNCHNSICFKVNILFFSLAFNV